MKKKLPTRRMNITPDDMKVGGLRWLDNKFTFTFHEWRCDKANLEVIIHLDFWFLEYIVEHILKVVNHAAEKIEGVRSAMRGQEQ